MDQFLAVYSEAGMVAVVGLMFCFMVYQNAKRAEQQAEAIQELKIENKGQSETLENLESIVLKMLDRWNKSDDISLRHREDIMKELAEMSDKVSYMSGRINGGNSR
jgi:flagellar biosynthesis/type III secretory pathway M-ring protein FliF/YscJ